MASCSNSWLFPDVSRHALASASMKNSHPHKCLKVFVGLPELRKTLFLAQLSRIPQSKKKGREFISIRCAKTDGPRFDPSKIEPPPYSSYMDSTSGQLEPASGARASIPGKEYWPEGTAARVRAARAPAPAGESMGTPSFGKNPGSRRKRYKEQAAASEAAETNVDDSESLPFIEASDDVPEEPKDLTDEYVIYQTEPEEDNASAYEMDKRIGRPHPFIDPAKVKPKEEPKSSEDLWWNWRKPGKDKWSRWQRRRPDVDTVFAKAMAETGQIKLFGHHPTLTEAALAKARRHLYKEERLQAEQRRLEEIGPIAYYSEWVEAYKHRDTSREAIQKHYEETGEDENTQLITMFEHQTAEEYRIMMGTDVRIRRDPLAMRMREDQIKQIWGGDPVYPTVNYVQDPDEVIDYRGPDFHEPTPDVLAYLMERGKIITRQELQAYLEKEMHQKVVVTEIDDAMASAVDIGEHDDEEDSDDDGEQVEKVNQNQSVLKTTPQPQKSKDEEDGEDDAEEVEEKVNRNWSVLKTTKQPQKSKEKPKKEGQMSLKDAIDDAENLTDFLMNFEEEE